MAIKLPVETNIEQLRARIDSTLNSIGDAFRTSNSKISKEYLGSDFSQAMKQRLRTTATEIAAMQAKAMEAARQGNTSRASSIVDSSKVKASQDIANNLKEEIRHVARLNTSYRRQKEIVEQILNNKKSALQTTKNLAEASLRSEYNDKINAANASGAPTGSIITERDTAVAKSNETFDELIDSIEGLAGVSKDRLNIERKLLRVQTRNLLREGASRIGGFGRSLGRGALAGAGLLGITSVVGVLTAMISEGMKLDEARSSTNGLRANISGEGGARFGKSQAETLMYARQAAIASGRSGYDAAGQLSFERGFGMDEGSMMGLAGLARLSNRNDSASQIGSQMVASFRDQGLFGMARKDGASSYAQLPEKMNLITDLLSQQSDRMKNIDEKQAIGVMSMFGREGYEDTNQISSISSNIDQSITSPADDFRRAFILNSLQSANPGDSYIDILRKQERGIHGEGNFNAIMDSLRTNFGGSQDMLSLNTSRLFGLTLDQSDRVSKMYMDGDEKGAFEEMEKLSAENDPVKQQKKILEDTYGEGGTVQQVHAKIKDYMAEGGVSLIKGVEPLISYMEELFGVGSDKGFLFALKKVKEDITGGIMDVDWKSVGAEIKEGFLSINTPREEEKNASKEKLGILSKVIPPSDYNPSVGDFLSEFTNSATGGLLGTDGHTSMKEAQEERFRQKMKSEVMRGSLHFDTNNDGGLSREEGRQAIKLIDESTLEELISTLKDNTQATMKSTGTLGEKYNRISYAPSRANN